MKCSAGALFLTVSREKSENGCALSLALSSKNCDVLFWTHRQTQKRHARSQRWCLEVNDLNTGDDNEFPEISQELNST